MVAIGHRGKEGKWKVRKPIQLTDLPANTMVWDTAVAINRTNKNNIVVSYGLLNFNTSTSETCRAVSFDGGKTWPENGPANIQPTGRVWRVSRVASDIDGNIWYLTTNADDVSFDFINKPTFCISPDGGVTTQSLIRSPFPAIFNLGVDTLISHICFGFRTGLGNYGLWFAADYYVSYGNPFTVDIVPIGGICAHYGSDGSRGTCSHGLDSG